MSSDPETFAARRFDKVLIANRGEIACRIIGTCRRLGIATVAVYSDADADARHVRLADQAVRIGPAPVRDSYLAIERMIEAARATLAQAIHPGYGLLSENADFADACTAAGIVFIGPPAAAIRAMGSKSAAKTLMQRAGVPLTPGYHGEEQDPLFLRREARQIGYPVLIKASAGGGGRGMRRVDTDAEFEAALAACQREAASAFGDQQVLVEKYLQQARHIEFQVFGDSHGHVVHLFERDCSVQRRHQKVLEEAPAPGMSAERRAAMGHAACEAARAVGYIGAGTVEFMVARDGGRDGAFYFMEMNTRLQVEHPVTELITGLDLVEWQLRIAAGESLPMRQEALAIRGHALEARIYAEDADHGFLPSTGRLLYLSPPRECAHVRFDTGVDQGDAITPYYDAMIAKLIVWDDNRGDALARMRAALAQCRIVGVANNVEFLSRLVATASFAGADLDTELIERERPALWPPPQPAPERAVLIAALSQLLVERQCPAEGACLGDPYSPWLQRDGWRINGTLSRSLRLSARGCEYALVVEYLQDGYAMTLGQRRFSVSGSRSPDASVVATVDDERVSAAVVHEDVRLHVFLGGHCHVFERLDPLAHTAAENVEESSLRAPMPGRIVALLAPIGAGVEKGKPLLILEAMKMEHTITAPAAGIVRAYRCAVGEQVGEGVELVEFARST